MGHRHTQTHTDFQAGHRASLLSLPRPMPECSCWRAAGGGGLHPVAGPAGVSGWNRGDFSVDGPRSSKLLAPGLGRDADLNRRFELGGNQSLRGLARFGDCSAGGQRESNGPRSMS